MLAPLDNLANDSSLSEKSRGFLHMANVGHPLWGDKLYGRGGQVLTPPVPGALLKHDPAPRQMLHAWHLSFIHPFTGEKMGRVIKA